MPIGDRVAGRSPARAAVRPNVSSAAFGAGIETAIKGLAGGFDNAADAAVDITTRLTARNEKTEDFDAEKRYIEFIGEQNRMQAERIRNTSESANGITNLSEDEINTANGAFLQSIPERLREQYDSKLTSFRETTVTSAFNYEYTAGNTKFVKDVNTSMNAEAAEVLQGNKSAEEAFSNITGLIQRSDLDETAQRDLTDQAQSFLLKAEFQKEIEYSKDFRGAVTPRTDGDVVAAGLAPHERGILNAISSPESSDRYDVLYGGERITDFSRHPRKYVTITSGPNKGLKSSAAGKYQFLASTWDATVAEYNAQNPHAPVTDFKPESQDRIALFYARRIFNRQLGAGEMDFDQILQSGDRTQIASMKRALWDDNGGWEGFRHMSDESFVNIIMGSQGIAGGGTGAPDNPDVWNNERYASLTFEQKLTLDNAANTAASQRDTQAAEAAKAQQNATTEAAMMSAIQGQHTLADMSQLIEQGQLPTSADVTKWQGLVEKAQKGASDRNRIANTLSSGGALYPGEDNQGLNLYVGDEGQAAIRGRDEKYAAETLVPLIAQAGFIPSESAKLLSDMVMSDDPKAREYATGVLSTAQSANPGILDRSAGINDIAAKQVLLTNQLRGLYTPDQIAERLRDMNDPRQSAVNANIRKEARKLFSDNLTTDDIVATFDSWMPGDAAAAPISVGQSEALRQDFQTAFAEGYLISGNEGKAKEYAEQLIKKHWAPTRIGGKSRLTKFPPESFYPAINGNHDWVEEQARDELLLGSGVEFQLVPDAQTEAEGKRYTAAEDKTGLGNASYQVSFINELGYPDVMRDAEGAPLRWAAEITSTMKMRVENSARYEQLRTEGDALVRASITTGGTPEQNARLAEVEAQLEELNDTDTYGDVNAIVRPQRKTDLIDKLAAAKKELEQVPSGNSRRRRSERELYRERIETLTRELENF